MVAQFILVPSQWNHIAIRLISCCYSLVKLSPQFRSGSFITSSFLLTVRPKHIITRLKQLAYRRATAQLSTYYLNWSVVGTCNSSRNCALFQPYCRVSGSLITCARRSKLMLVRTGGLHLHRLSPRIIGWINVSYTLQSWQYNTVQ